MRLINVDTLCLEEFLHTETPHYAILSHTWSAQEVSYESFTSGTWRVEPEQEQGRQKILGSCAVAASEGFGYVWIDTCCIDKTSSAELSEAINSMFRWYYESSICYAYLQDVDSTENPSSQGSSFSSSRWFRRGWTLQELLAPAEVVFLGQDWIEIGTKRSLQTEVATAANISKAALADRRWNGYSVAQKMSWAANRETSRPEDEAYCLMGLFDINMPLLYGEGHRAFFRLQTEILKTSEDESMFAWTFPAIEQRHTKVSGLFAPSPHVFRDSSDIKVMRSGAILGDRRSFEYVRQLVCARLPILGPFSGIKLNTTEPMKAVEVADVEPTSFKADSDDDLNVDHLVVPEHRQPKLARLETSTPNSRWQWYIYEPVFIIPLMCSIKNNRVAIIFTQSPSASTDDGMYRLHAPSIISVEDVLLSKSTIDHMYVYGMLKSQNDMDIPLSSKSSEIRMLPLIKAGYKVFGKQRSDWLFYQQSKKLVMTGRADETNQVLLFQHQSEDRRSFPSFFVQIHFEQPVVGISGSGGSVLNQHVWRIMMTYSTYAEVPILGTDKAIILKKRELARERYLSLSLGVATQSRKAPMVTLGAGAGALMRWQNIWNASDGLVEHFRLHVTDQQPAHTYESRSM